MKHVFLIICVLIVSFGAVGNLSAQESLIETVANGCKTELETYCKTVTPGEGRVLACLYAYGDKLSGKCEYALYDAAARLERRAREEDPGVRVAAVAVLLVSRMRLKARRWR